MQVVYDGKQAYIMDECGDGVYLEFRNETASDPLKVLYGDDKLNIDPTDSEWFEAEGK